MTAKDCCRQKRWICASWKSGIQVDSFDCAAGSRPLFQPLTQFARVYGSSENVIFHADIFELWTIQWIHRQTHILCILLELVFVPVLFTAVACYCYRQSHLNAYLFVVSILLSSHHDTQRRFAVVVFIFISYFYPTRRMCSLYAITQHTIAFAWNSHIPRCHFNTLLKMTYRNKGYKWLICFFTTFITNFSQNINIYSLVRCCFIRISTRWSFLLNESSLYDACDIYRDIMASFVPMF